MRTATKNILFLSYSLCAGALFLWWPWLAGHNVSPAPFGGPITFFLTYLLPTIPMIIFIIALVRLIKNPSPLSGRLSFFLAALGILAATLFVRTPSKFDGFKSRMSRVEPEQLRGLAAKARALARKNTENPNPDWVETAARNREIVKILAEKYPFLKLGSNPPELFLEKAKTIVSWGDGYVGILGIEIWKDGFTPKYNRLFLDEWFELHPGIYLTYD